MTQKGLICIKQHNQSTNQVVYFENIGKEKVQEEKLQYHVIKSIWQGPIYGSHRSKLSTYTKLNC